MASSWLVPLHFSHASHLAFPLGSNIPGRAVCNDGQGREREGERERDTRESGESSATRQAGARVPCVCAALVWLFSLCVVRHEAAACFCMNAGVVSRGCLVSIEEPSGNQKAAGGREMNTANKKTRRFGRAIDGQGRRESINPAGEAETCNKGSRCPGAPVSRCSSVPVLPCASGSRQIRR